MFKKFRLKNYRTHVDTSIELNDVTLFIGSNNSGKTNLLSGLNYFSRLVSMAFPEAGKNKKLTGRNFFPHKHSLSDDNTPISFYCEWEGHENRKATYELELYCIDARARTIGCKERLDIFYNNSKETMTHGYSEPSQELLLRTIIKEDGKLTYKEKMLAYDFFKSLSFLYYYHFQPTFLKGEAFPIRYSQNRAVPAEKKDFSKQFQTQEKKPNIAGELGKDGANFQELIKYVKEHEEETYGNFLGYLKRFVKSFNGIIIDKGTAKWQFDMGGAKFPYFEPNKISDGLVKAGAIALLCAMKTPPSMIMIEEVENGINQKNISEFLSWISGACKNEIGTQFILTSHSPSVIREFSQRLDSVYNVAIREQGYTSMLTNLNEAIKPYITMGMIEEEDLIEIGGKQVVQVSAHEVINMFYTGMLGSL